MLSRAHSGLSLGCAAAESWCPMPMSEAKRAAGREEGTVLVSLMSEASCREGAQIMNLTYPFTPPFFPQNACLADRCSPRRTWQCFDVSDEVC